MNAILEPLSGYSATVLPILPGLKLSARRVILHQDADNDGWWTVECPSLPGCISQGETTETALENIREAMELWLEVGFQSQILPTPLPTTIEISKEPCPKHPNATAWIFGSSRFAFTNSAAKRRPIAMAGA